MPNDVTQLLHLIADGRDSGVNELLPLVYGELRRLAERFLEGERSDHTLQATALVHEAYLKLVDQQAARFEDRAHFFAIAAQAMRRILVDHARSQGRLKRGEGRRNLSLDTQAEIAHGPGVDMVALDDALQRLAELRPNSTRIVELRYFGGMTTDEIAAALGISARTVEREWRYARAWLYKDLFESDTSIPPGASL